MIKILSRRTVLLTPALLAFGLSFGQNYENVVQNYLNKDVQTKNASEKFKEFSILNTDNSKSLNGDVLSVQQKINGLPLFSKSATLLIRDNQVLSGTNGFFTAASSKNVPSATPKKSLQDAFSAITSKYNLKSSDFTLRKLNEKVSSKLMQKGNAKEDVLSTLVYFPKGEDLHLAYLLTFQHKGSASTYLALVDANTLEILKVSNKTIHDHFGVGGASTHQPNLEHLGTKTVAFPQKETSTANPKVLNNASYNVYKLPVEAPNFGDRTLISNPWIAESSPLGWHESQDASIDEFSEYTIGNNVFAYTDLQNNDTLEDVSQLAYGGANRIFDFPLDLTQQVETYQDAAITNLFYINNMMHDITYKFGFTESARNYQVNNFANGGAGNDPVHAQARDGGATDNANFTASEDGAPGKMQMYLWSPTNMKGLKVNSPSDLSTFEPTTHYAVEGMGPRFPSTGTTNDLVLADPILGCSNLNNTNVTGKFVLIMRGDCNFVDKVKFAQNAGAAGVVLFNQPTSVPINSFGGADASITIPSVLLSDTDGNVLKAKLDQNVGVNLTIRDYSDTAPRPDGSLDNGIVAHEYTHGISNRLTGTGSNCLDFTSDNEQMGEGWSDYLALMLTLKPTDNQTIPRGVGTYVYGQPTTGLGIRPRPYSPDFTINDYTYGRTNGMEVTQLLFGFFPIGVPDVHSIGFVWNTMLWDLTWKYVEKYGYNNDVTADPTSGTARALQVVMDGMKLQPCNPTFVDGRDAIIAADQAQTGGENKCLIEQVFAKRGLGINAQPGGLGGFNFDVNTPNPDLNDQVEDFTVSQECQNLATEDASLNSSVSIYPNPAKSEIFIKASQAKGKVQVKIFDLSGKLVKEATVDAKNAESINISNLVNGVYIVKGQGIGTDFSKKIIVKK